MGKTFSKKSKTNFHKDWVVVVAEAAAAAAAAAAKWSRMVCG
jgi:hypothetical protein